MKKTISILLLFLTFLFANVGNATAQQKHEYVDLGLPSGTLWATCNVGASTPWDYGDYFAWGEIETKFTYSWTTYKYANGASNKLTKYCNKSSQGNNGFTDSRTTLENSDDVAYQKWGSEWCMPTRVQFWELRNNCTSEWTTNYQGKGVAGRIYKSRKNGNTIFFPAAGWKYSNGTLGRDVTNGSYWSSSVYDANYAWRFDLSSDDAGTSIINRNYGFSVHPVRCSN